MSRALCVSARGRRAVAALLLLTSVAAYVSLVFVPPFALTRDVTHCWHTTTAAPNWGILSLHNRNLTTKSEANVSFHHVVQEAKDETVKTSPPEIKPSADPKGLQSKIIAPTSHEHSKDYYEWHKFSEVKDKTSDTSPPEMKTLADPKHLQSKITAPAPHTNELSKDYNEWQKFNDPRNREMETYNPPKHNSDDIDAKQTFDDKLLGKKTSPVPSLNEGRKGILNSYQKIENSPFNFNYELPVSSNSQENNLPNIPNGDNDSNMLPKPDDTEYRYQLHHLKPVPSVNQQNYHYQWSDQYKIDEQKHSGTSEARVEGGGKMPENPERMTFQKNFLQKQPNNIHSMTSGRKPYLYQQPLHIHSHREQHLNEADNGPHYYNNQYKVDNIQQEDEQEEENVDLPKPYGQVKSLYHNNIPAKDVNGNRIVKRKVPTKISNSDAVKSVDGVDLFHLELVTSNRMVLREITARKGVSYNMTDLSQLLQKDTVLNSHLNSTSETANSSLSVTNSVYRDSIAYFYNLQGFGASKYGSWSTVFYTVFAISVFLETSCQSTLVWILRLCGVMTQNTCEVLKELATNNRMLVGWSVIVCPLVGVVAALSPCPYQITAHMVAAAALTFCVLLVLPLISPVSRSRKRKPSKPSYRKTYEDMHATLIKRFSFSLRMGITGCITACNLEFMMWYMETQETFSHNYEYLYCGYSASASITQFLVNRLLKQRSKAAEDAESESEEEMGSGQWQPHRVEPAGHQRWWWVWEAGTLLLAVEQLAAQLQPVWLLPPLLGALQGAGTALSSGGPAWGAGVSYSVGYGCGCLAAGLFVQTWGAAALFQVLGVATSVCAAAAAIIRGLMDDEM